MRRLFITAAVAAAALLAVPAMASASYTISRGEAQLQTRHIAADLYSDYGIRFGRSGAYCEPQFVKYNPRYTYHRWVCTWAGRDWDGDMAYGRMRITGHSSGTIGYIVLSGIHWR